MADQLQQIELSGERLALYEALFRRSERIARMYMGIHFALRDGLNPERFPCGAHCARELIEKVPEIVAVRTPAHSVDMGAKVAELENFYNEAVANSKLRAPLWDGEIDGPLRKFLKAVEAFFTWKKENRPGRRREIKMTMRALDGPGRVLPPDSEDALVDEWMQLKNYFLNICHHQTAEPAPEEFDVRLQSLERILLRKLNPQTFADFDLLDAIIKAGEEGNG